MLKEQIVRENKRQKGKIKIARTQETKTKI